MTFAPKYYLVHEIKDDWMHGAYEGENRNARKVFAGKPEGKRALWKTQASMR
jgi:hypothetical protein